MSALTPLSLGSLLSRPAAKSTLPKRKLFKWLPDGTLELRIDWSSIESFLSCNRSAEYKLVHSRTSAPRSALVFGAAFHSALEVWYRLKANIDNPCHPVSYELLPPSDPLIESGGSIILTKENIVQLGIQMIDKTYAEYPSNFIADYRTSEFCVECFLKYLKHYDQEQLVVASYEKAELVEFSFAMPLGMAEINSDIFHKYGYGMLTDNEALERAYDVVSECKPIPVKLDWTGIIDLVCHTNNAYWVVDHKTSSINSDGFFDGFEIAMQPTGYVTAARAALPDLNIKGFMVNAAICRKPTKTGTSFEAHRRFYEYSKENEDEFKLNVLYIVEEFLANLTNGYFPMKTNWCIGKYGKCPYFEVCTLPQKSRLDMLNSSAYTDNTWKPVT